MSLTLAWTLFKTFGSWLVLVLIVTALIVLVLDRNHLAALNDQHTACLASIQDKPGAKPAAQTCDPVIAAAATEAAAASACNTGLATGDTFAASQACAGPTKTLMADRDAKASEVANLTSQLAGASADRDAAIARATARAQATIQGLTHAQTVLAAAPKGGDGLSVCDAQCLRQLSGAPAAP